MKICGIDHIAIDARDIGESVRFYRDVMGFEVENRVPNGDTELVYLRVDERSRLELFDHFRNLPDRTECGDFAGAKHIALSVEGIDDWNRRLLDAGVEFTLPLQALDHLGVRALLFKDPNGVVIELSENL